MSPRCAARRLGGLLAAVAVAASCGLTRQPPGEPVTPDAGTRPPASTSSATSGDEATTGSSAPTSSSTPEAPSPTGTPGAPVDVSTGLDVPWSVVVLPDGGALVSLRDEGRVVRIGTDGRHHPVVAPGPDGVVPDVRHGGEGGLLGLALHPDDASQLFVYSTAEDGNRVTRWTFADDRLSQPRVVLDGIPAAGNHNGGRIAFGPDGYLYVATGDAGRADEAQQRESLAGKILRVTTDGAPAPGNPFPRSPVWSLGHRNVQGLGWSPDGTMYASEFGQNRLDELNRILPGRNYGWPQVEGSDGAGGFEDPLVTWPVAQASPSGLLVTADAVYLAALRGQRLWRVPLARDGVGRPRAYVTDLGRLRDVVLAPGGESLWLLTSNTFRGDPGPDDDRLVEVPLR